MCETRPSLAINNHKSSLEGDVRDGPMTEDLAQSGSAGVLQECGGVHKALVSRLVFFIFGLSVHARRAIESSDDDAPPGPLSGLGPTIRSNLSDLGIAACSPKLAAHPCLQQWQDQL